MLIHDPAVEATLRRIVAGLESNPDCQKDLLQEALLHLWSEEQRYPEQQLCWYLENCKFHLLHLCDSGRSVDSPKHSCSQVVFPDNYAWQQEWPYTSEFDDGIMSQVNADDIICLLENRLKPIDQTILEAFVEGLRICDIARKINRPRGFAERHRLHIAKLALKLGINPRVATSLSRSCQ